MSRPLQRALCLVVALLLAAPMRRAQAHSFDPAVLDLHEAEAGVFDVVWKLPASEAGTLTLLPQFPAHCQHVDRFTSSKASPESPTFWQVDCGDASLYGQSLTVSGLDGSRLDVIVRIAWRDGATTSGVLRSGATELAVPHRPRAGLAASGTPAYAVLCSYLRLGVAHILFGLDHLLFVLGLLLLVGSWGMLIKTISAFTVAHSLALALATLNVIAVPAAPVEALIAVSILLVAAELTRPADTAPTLTRRYPWAIAFIFGLLHGLGFAGALAEIGLPPDQIALALLAFNLGVEVGQLAFVAVMAVPLALAPRMTARWPQVRLIPPYAIGSLAVAWTIERIQRFWTPWG